MSLYLGKNNSNVNVLHMTRGNTSKDNMKEGLLNNTVYHSEYPFFEFIDTQIYTMPSDGFSPGTFTIPYNILKRIVDGVMFGVFCEYDNQLYFEQMVYSYSSTDSDGTASKYSYCSPGFKIPTDNSPPYYGRVTEGYPKNMNYSQLYIEQSVTTRIITRVMLFTYGANNPFTNSSIYIDKTDVNIKGVSLKRIKKLISDPGYSISGGLKIKTLAGKYFWITNVFSTITDTLEIKSNNIETYIKAGNIPLLTTSSSMHNGNVIKSGTIHIPSATFVFPWNSNGSKTYISPSVATSAQIPENTLYNVWLRSYSKHDRGGLLLASLTGQPTNGYLIYEDYSYYIQDYEEWGSYYCAFRIKINSQFQFELTFIWTINWMNPGYFNDLYLDYELVI